jgi:hypothetical protein
MLASQGKAAVRDVRTRPERFPDVTRGDELTREDF